MKLAKVNLIAIIAFSIFFAISCKKYPDGPILSLHTKKHRIIGTWDVEYFSINNYDSTVYLRSQPFYGMYSFGKGDFLGNNAPALYHSGNGYHDLNGTWTFEEHKEAVQILLYNDTTSPGSIGPYRYKNVIWDIRRLTEKELWLATFFEGKDYFVKFKLSKN